MSRSPHARILSLPLAALVLAGACAQTPAADGADVEPPVSVDRIRDRPEEYIGERVRIAAHVAEVHGTRILTLRDDDPMFKEQMLVVTRRSLARLLGEEKVALKPGIRLLVSGLVRRFDAAELEQELNLTFDPKLEQRFRGKPMIVASEVVRTDDAGPAADAPDTLSPRN